MTASEIKQLSDKELESEIFQVSARVLDNGRSNTKDVFLLTRLKNEIERRMNQSK